MIFALTSKVYDKGAMYDAASSIIVQKLLQIPGVGTVNVGGSSLPSVRVEVNPTQLNAYGLSLGQVSASLRQQNSNVAKGQLSDDTTTANILTNDQLFKASDYRPLIVGYHNGAAVRLSDIADVQDSVENIRAAGFANGQPSILCIISKAPGANIIETVDRIQAVLPSLKASIPAAMNLTILLDQTKTIRASVRQVEEALTISVCLVILVVFAFLRSPRATFIPSVVVPVSLIGTFGVMYLFGFSIDNLSLMALTIATGFVVDDAIVVIENITRYLEQGMSPMQAALRGASEIGFTVLSMSLSLVSVFIPILLMGGIVGRLFREFAVTLTVAILISMCISLTATPMMCSRLLKHDKGEEHGRIYMASENFFNWMLKTYERLLTVVLHHQALTLATLVLTIALNIFLFITIPKGFFPQQDNGTIQGGALAAQDISYQAMQADVKQLASIIMTDPAVQSVSAFTGGGGAINQGNINIQLKPFDQRSLSSSQVINRLRPKLSSIPGVTAFLQAGQDLRIGGRQSLAQYQYTIQSDSVDDLIKWGPILLSQIARLPGFADVNSDQQTKGLQAFLHYDRATASRMGITPQSIDTALYDAFGQSQASVMYTSLNQYHVVLEVAPQFWQSPQELNDVYLKSASGARFR